MSEPQPMIQLGDNAVKKIQTLMDEENNDKLMFRVYITGGGCSGFQYGFSFDEDKRDGDTEITRGKVTMVIDPMSFQYLVGAEVDYSETLMGSKFEVKNPNATTTCGCGSSFSI